MKRLAPLLMLIVTVQAHAAPVRGGGVLDDILDRFEKVASTWSIAMVNYASWLFWGLVLISMVWTYGMMILRKADIGEFFAETIRFLATTGFFWWILKNGPAISVSIMDTLRIISAKATGLGNTITPSSIVNIGFDIANKVVDSSSRWEPVNTGVGLIIAAIILVVLALVGVNMLLLLVSGWLLAYGAVFLLGFGGGRWTSDIAIAYYKTVLGIAVQLFAMILIVGVGKSFIDQYYAATMNGAVTVKNLLVMLVASIILLMLVAKVPPMFAGIVGGPSAAGIGGFGAGAAVGAAAAAAGVAAGVASAGASLAMGGAANLAGAGSALQAAFQSAQANMGGGGGGGDAGSSGSGGGDTGSVGGSEGGGGGGGGSSGGGGGGSSFGQAMGTAGRFAADMGGSLVGGAKSGLAAKGASMFDSAKERVSQTAGGKLAAEINGTAGQARNDAQTMERAGEIRQEQELQEARSVVSSYDNPAPQTEPQFDGDSVASGRPDIDAFVNGKA